MVIEGGLIDPIYGCTNVEACNYDELANTDNGTCEYPADGFNCAGECVIGEDCNGECGGLAEVDCEGVCNGDASFDECGVCNGGGASYECFDGSLACNASSCVEGAILSFGGMTGNTVQVLYASSEAMGGVQFSISGAEITGAEGGASSEAGWTVSSSVNTWIGFSFSNVTIPAGSGVLTELTVSGDGSEICFTNAVVSDQTGNSQIETTTGACVLPDPIYGCIDANACNYDELANTDNGTCEYPADGFNCAGECVIGEDCNGDCGGLAIEDCLGVCGGDAEELECGCNEPIADGACDCVGNVEDACGVCGGDVANADECGMPVYYSSPEAIAGFQFNVEGVTILGASGGVAESSGFTVSTSSTTVLGFSFDGSTIPSGNGLLTFLETENGQQGGCLHAVIISGTDGNAGGLNVEVSNCNTLVIEGGYIEPIFGCIDLGACNFDILANTSDNSCIYYEDCNGECGGVAEVDECGVCDGIGEMMCWDGSETCEISNCPTEPQYFTNLPAQTGVTNLVVLSNILGLNPGDEIGLFDSNALISDGSCSNETGELLVGTGVYTGEQLEIVSVGSLDYCDAGGAQHPGFINGNQIVFKIWSHSMDYEYIANEVTFSIGSGNWGNLISYVDMLDGNIYGCTDSEAMNYNMYANIDDGSCYFVVTQDITLIPGFLNNISLNVNLDNMNPEDVFSGINLLIASNDHGDYFMPSLNVNSIGEMNNSDGYLVYFNGNENQTMSLTGMPASLETIISLDPYSVNYIGFTPQSEISVEEVFTDIPVFIVADQFGNYFVPALGINSIDESGGMKPGQGYMVYHGNDEIIEFTYPSGLARETILTDIISIEARRSNQYDIVETGNSYPILITEMYGNIEVGDEVVAYANGEVVGATRISELNSSIVVTAWGNLNNIGVDSDGFDIGDDIELRLWSSNKNKELNIIESFDNSKYGEAVFSLGKIEILEQLEMPITFSLEQNFPNPFNPTTLISFTIMEDQEVELNIFDIKGNLINSLLNGNIQSGNHSIEWNAIDENGMLVPAGIYFYSLQTNQQVLTRKMVLMK